MEEGALMMMDYGNLISVVLGAIPSVLAAVLFARKTKKAEVRAKEAEARAKEIENKRGDIGIAKEMIDLVKIANAEANVVQQNIIDTLKNENERFEKIVNRLENAFDAIDRCDYRDGCPVYAELQGGKSNSGKRE